MHPFSFSGSPLPLHSTTRSNSPVQVFPSFGGSTYLFCCPHDDFPKYFPTFFCISVCLQLVFLFHFVFIFFFCLQSPDLNSFFSVPSPMFPFFLIQPVLINNFISAVYLVTPDLAISLQKYISRESTLGTKL